MSGFKYIALIAVLPSGSPGFAQNNGNPRWNSPEDQAGRLILHNYLSCQVRRWPDKARELIGAVRGSEVEQTACEAFLYANSGCSTNYMVINEVTVGTGALRGYVANKLFAVEFDGHIDAADLAVEFDDTRTVERLENAEDRASELIAIIANCTVNRGLEPAWLLVRVFDRDFDRTAIAELTDDLSACAYERMQVSFSAVSLRAAIAEALYERAIQVSSTRSETTEEAGHDA